jgi:uncharacterized protein with NAD-binding domain and iron-sulfur cluster
MSKQKLAVLGGGMSSLVALFELTSQPDWKSRWDITLYQMGWRLGGKGASGRSADATKRIEEHGLHLLFGCYENAFRILDAVYQQMPHETGERVWSLDQALEPHDHVVMYEQTAAGWEAWPLDTVRRDGFPGRGEPVPLGPRNYIDLLLRWALAEVERWIGGIGPMAVANAVAAAAADAIHAGHAAQHLDEASKWIGEALAAGEAQPHAAGAVGDLFDWDAIVGRFVSLCDAALDRMRAVAHPSPALRHAVVTVEFTLTVVKGLLVDGALSHAGENWSAIDDDDLRAWLARHGASPAVLASAPTRGLYAAVFSDGRPVAAGSILHALVRASHFKGAAIYKMKAGMGDTIFAPLYRVLRDRGVRFEFFHRVEALELSADRRRVERVRMWRQVELRDPAAGYHPLVTVNGLPCWPDRPRVEELAPAEAAVVAQHDLENWWDPFTGREEKVIEVQRDFDRVLLGISIGAFPDICRELIEDAGNPRFAKTVSAVLASETQSAQLWMTKDAQQLGRPDRPVVIPYASPFDTCAEMSHLLVEENHGPAVKSLVYPCSRMDDDEPVPPARLDPAYPARQRERVRQHLGDWLEQAGPFLWPGAADANGAFDWNVLDDPKGGVGRARLDAQWWIACQNPSDRYVLAVPGSTRYRLRAEESGYENVTLTGDWTMNDMNVGCLEGATMAGIRSARALDPRIPLPVYAWLPEPKAVAHAAGALPAAAAARSYVPRDGEMLVMPPVDLDVQLTSFFAAADARRLQDLCDRELNLGGPRRYRPAGPFVIFYCSQLDNRVPEGAIEETDFGVWVPVFSGREVGGVFQADRLLTYSPYGWVSNSPALVGGRSVFGFPKHVARLGQPIHPGDPALFGADTWVVDVPGGRAHEARLLEIQRRDTAAWPGLGSAWNPTAIAKLLGALFHPGLPPAHFTVDLLGQLLRRSRGMPMVFLKQFPAADGTSAAVYQAIVEADVDLTGPSDGGFVDGRWEIGARACVSHDLTRTLGLPHRRERRADATWCVMDALAQGWMKFTSRVKPGRVIS